MNSVAFKCWVTLEFSRRHGNLKPKRFDFCIKYKPIDRVLSYLYRFSRSLTGYQHGMVYGISWRAWHGIWYGLQGMTWPGEWLSFWPVTSKYFWFWVWYGPEFSAGYIVAPGGHGMVYGIAWRGMGWYMVWLCGMTCICHVLAGMAWYMVWSCRHGMVYDVVWWAWLGIWYGLVGIAWYTVGIGLARCGMVYLIVWWGMAWYMVWPVRHDILYRMVWWGMARYMV